MPSYSRLTAIRDQLLPNPMETITIALGELHPLEEEQLRAQWHELTIGTPLADTTLVIRIIPAEQQCMVCFLKYRPQHKETACPQCGSVGAKILSGEELYLESS